jgi:hypothetical protein
MKKTFVSLSLIALLVLSGIADGVENPNIGPAFGPSTTVPSANQSRRMMTPSDPTSGNAIVTGNVSGMKYFRGIVPYGSSYYTGNSGNDSGSQSVSNFLRRSAEPIASDRNPGLARPYYQPERTTTRFVRPDSMGIKTPASPTSVGRNNPFVLSNSPQLQDAQIRQRPLSSDRRRVEDLLDRQHLREKEPPAEFDSKLLIERVEKKATEPLNLIPLNPTLQQDAKQPDESKSLRPEEEVLAEFQKETEKAIQEQKTFRSEREPFTAESKLLRTEGTETKSEDENPEETAKKKAQDAALGRKIMGEHKTYDSLAQERYKTYMQAAEQFMKEGKFYKAADVYELASLWQPDEARGYLGKGFSLFGAGEYMSSSYYVGRAIEMDPSLAGQSFDLANLIGNRDVFENRLLEITGWQEKSGSGELAFLMAYVLYHDGKVQQAAAAIAKAEQAMPGSRIVEAIKTVINGESTAP